MRFKKISSVINYSAWLLKNYNKEHTQSNIYRIVELEQLPTNEYKLFIQVIGKSTFFECTPQEIVNDDSFLEGFSKKEIRTITFLACNERKKPKYKVLIQEFTIGFNKILFKLKNRDTNEIFSKTADQITVDKNLIKNLSHEDVCSVSYTAGLEHASLEK